jgi:hypothetical protein
VEASAGRQLRQRFEVGGTGTSGGSAGVLQAGLQRYLGPEERIPVDHFAEFTAGRAEAVEVTAAVVVLAAWAREAATDIPAKLLRFFSHTPLVEVGGGREWLSCGIIAGCEAMPFEAYGLSLRGLK